MRCGDEPESRTARSVPNRLSVASRSNGGRRHGLDQASAGPEGGLVQKSIGAVPLVRRQKTGPIPQPVSRFVCLTWGNIENIGCVWSLVIGSRVCFRKNQVGGGSDAARGRPARDQIVLLPVSCVPPSRPTGHLGPPRDHCGSGGGATLFRTRWGRGGARDTAGGVRASVRPASCAAPRGGLRLGGRHPEVVSHLVRPQRHLVCFGPAALCALPRPLVQRARGRWDPRARSSTGAA